MRRQRSHIGRRLIDAKTASHIEIDVAESRTPPASSTASTIDSRLDPTRPRRAVACRATWAPPAPDLTSSGRVPRCRQDRGAGRTEIALGEKQREGFATSHRPSPVISNMPISSVGPKRFLTARKMRKWCEPSPSNESTASTMSTTRGLAIWPSQTWLTRMMAAPDRLAKRISACAEARTCATVPV
jgi:hypothetical protein